MPLFSFLKITDNNDPYTFSIETTSMQNPRSVPKENRENFDNMIDDYDVFSNHLADLFEITGDDNDKVSKDRLENLFHEKHIKWDQILREIKKLEKKGLKYDKAKRIFGKRGSTGALIGHGIQYVMGGAASAAGTIASAAGSAIASAAGSSTDPIDVDPDNHRSRRTTQNRRPPKYRDSNFETNFRPGRRRRDDDDLTI